MNNPTHYFERNPAVLKIARRARVSLAAARVYAEHLRMTGPEQDAWAPIGAVANRVVDRLERALPEQEGTQ